MLNAVASEQLYDETSTPRAGTILKQAEFIPGLIQRLQDEPEKVIEEFEAIRQIGELDLHLLCFPLANKPYFSVIRPEGIRFSVTGNILDIQSPKKPWREHFSDIVSLRGYFSSTKGITLFQSPVEPNTSTTRPFFRRDLERTWQETHHQGLSTPTRFLMSNSHISRPSSFRSRRSRVHLYTTLPEVYKGSITQTSPRCASR